MNKRSRIKTTEREVASWISGYINEILKSGGYPFVESTVETSLTGEGKSRFPDIVIWKNRESEDAFSFFELKSPGKREDLTILPEKAEKLKVKYCLVWDFNEATHYEIDNVNLQRVKTYTTYPMLSLEDWKKKEMQVKIQRCIVNFLNELKELHDKGNLHDFVPDKIFFTKLLRETVDQLYPYFAQYLKKVVSDKKLKNGIESWAVKQGIANVGDEAFYETLAHQWVYTVITKTIFYLTLKKHFVWLPKLVKDPSSPQPLERLIRLAFKEAQKIDWQAVFDEGIIEKTGMPKKAEDILTNLLQNLQKYNFGLLREDVIGEIFEELIPPQERHDLGQYFTREDLVDFIVGFVAQSPEGYYGDPTCGSGTFLNRLYSKIRWLSGYKKTHSDLLRKIWGIDIAHFPAELATINLFRQNVADYSNFPRVVVKDFFEIKPQDEFEFPPPKAHNGTYIKIKERVPCFVGLVGNFPYIRQNLIEKRNKGYRKFLNTVIVRDWFLEFPEVFSTKKIQKTELKEIKKQSPDRQKKQVEEWTNGGLIELNLSRQSDIYAYLFFHVARFLSSGGRLGIVTSNSWLDVAYGLELKRFFLKKFKIIAIVSSSVEPWFEAASINTIFTILERCDNEKEKNDHVVKFVKLKKKLEDLILYRDLKLQEDSRWRQIDALVRKIEYADKGSLISDKSTSCNELETITTLENVDFRIRLVKQSVLLDEIEEKEEIAKWGKYLRAPDVYFEILEKARNKMVQVGKYADTETYLNTGGADKFFFLTEEQVKEWSIPSNFLSPIIKSSEELTTIEVPRDFKFKWYVLAIDRKRYPEKNNLPLEVKKYIAYGEQRRFNRVSGRKDKDVWWCLPKQAYAGSSILVGRTVNDVFIVFHNPNKFITNRFYRLNSKEGIDEDLLCGLLNSTLFALIREVESSVNLGEGALNTYEIGKLSFPALDQISSDIKQKIVKKVKKIKVNPIKPIFQETKRKGRQELDKAVLEALDLDEKYLPMIYTGLTELVKERLDLSGLRKIQKRKKTKKSIEEIKKFVEEELLESGLKQFPEAWVDKNYLKDALEISTTGKKLKIGMHFFGKYSVVDEVEQKIYEANGIEEVKFLVYSHKLDIYILKLPRSSVIVQKAVREYETYIKELKEKIITRAFQATFDHKISEQIMEEILQDHGYNENIT